MKLYLIYEGINRFIRSRKRKGKRKERKENAPAPPLVPGKNVNRYKWGWFHPPPVEGFWYQVKMHPVPKVPFGKMCGDGNFEMWLTRPKEWIYHCASK